MKLAPEKRNDPSNMVRIADLYKRLNEPKKALKYYVLVGEFYGERGFFNKAVAAFKKGLNLDPKNEGVLTKLAELNEKVPKYMIDSSIMEKIRNLDAQKESGSGPDSIITPGGRVIEEPEPIPVADLDITLGPEQLESIPQETPAPSEVEEPAPSKAEEREADPGVPEEVPIEEIEEKPQLAVEEAPAPEPEIAEELPQEVPAEPTVLPVAYADPIALHCYNQP